MRFPVRFLLSGTFPSGKWELALGFYGQVPISRSEGEMEGTIYLCSNLSFGASVWLVGGQAIWEGGLRKGPAVGWWLRSMGILCREPTKTRALLRGQFTHTQIAPSSI